MGPSPRVELRQAATYVKRALRPRRIPGLKSIGLAEIERIFAVTDALGISREALVIPLRTEHPGRIRKIAAGKLEIVADSEDDFARWLNRLESEIRAVWPAPPRA